MNLLQFKIIVPLLYLLLVGFVFASELYTRIYDRGNSEMAGLGTYLLTMPSSALTDWLSTAIFGVKVGDSDNAFVCVLGFAVILNALFIYLLATLLESLFRKLG